MKEGWEIKKLGEVCEELFAGGDVPKDNLSKFETDDYQIPIFSNGEKNKGLYGFTNVARVIKPSITISARGTIGYSEIRYKSFYPAIRLIVVIPKTNVLDLFFLKYVVSGIDFKHSGSSIPQLTVPMIKGYPIPLPPLPEQQRIVAILDEVFSFIAKAKANAEQNLKNSKELFESYLQGVFENKGEGWEEKTLGDVSEQLFAGGDVPKGNSSKFKTDEFNIPIFSNGEKNKGLYGYSKVSRVTKPSITISARGTIGYSEIRKNAFYPAIRLIVITPKMEIIDLSYLKYVINGIDFKHSGSSIPQLTVPMIKEYPISFPSLKEQQKIVQKLDALSLETKKLESIYQQKINDLEELKKSVLQKAFAGELKNNAEVTEQFSEVIV
jgi:type I restriction enzyme S subunit